MNKTAQVIALQKFAIDCINNGKLKLAKESLTISIDLMPEARHIMVDDYLIELLNKNGGG